MIIPYVKFGVAVLRYVAEMLGISMRWATDLCKYFCSFMAWFYVQQFVVLLYLRYFSYRIVGWKVFVCF